jgi:hypothetical protein
MNLSKTQTAEILVAFVLILWRIFARLGDVFVDWLALGAAWWILSTLLSGRKAWGPVALAVGSALSALYLLGRVIQ